MSEFNNDENIIQHPARCQRVTTVSRIRAFAGVRDEVAKSVTENRSRRGHAGAGRTEKLEQAYPRDVMTAAPWTACRPLLIFEPVQSEKRRDSSNFEHISIAPG
jgi:hypothetical protein